MKTITLISITFAVILILITGVRPALAVDDLGLFELDSNAVQDAPAPPDDWETLYNGDPNSSIIFTGIIVDAASSANPGFEDTIFVGGRKDIQDIDQWGWKKSSGFPDKDEITNAYSAAYLDDNDDLIVYFGMDRFANNGDSYLGFWFFQDKVGPVDGGSFSGHHQPGDLLVLVNFPQATNKSPEINVVMWDPPGEDAKNLTILHSGVVCEGGGGTACATTNAGDETSPWPYTPKRGSSGTFPYESFFEGGINLTELLGWTPCFTSFMAESRSSKKFTATLKDFAHGDFEICGISVEKECDVIRLANEGDDTEKFFVVDFNGTVTNTGAGAFPAGSTITVRDYTADSNVLLPPIILQEPFNPGDTNDFSGQFFTDLNPPYNKVTASITFPGSETTVFAEEFSVDCVKFDLHPDIDLWKDCWLELETAADGNLVVVVYFKGGVENTGNVPLTVTVTDDKVVGIVFGPNTIDPCESAAIEEHFYYPTQSDLNVDFPCNADFNDTLTAVFTSPIPGVDPNEEVVSDTCKLCPEDCPEE